MWLVSASMRILSAPCPDHLAQRFGWLNRPSVSVLAAQLLELGRMHGQSVSCSTPHCFGAAPTTSIWAAHPA